MGVMFGPEPPREPAQRFNCAANPWCDFVGYRRSATWLVRAVSKHAPAPHRHGHTTPSPRGSRCNQEFQRVMYSCLPPLIHTAFRLPPLQSRAEPRLRLLAAQSRDSTLRDSTCVCHNILLSQPPIPSGKNAALPPPQTPVKPRGISCLPVSRCGRQIRPLSRD
jgi:hypothetical protein